MSPWIPIELIAWDGVRLPCTPKKGEPVVFCQLCPSPEILQRADELLITWIPMWDDARRFSQEWWNKIPKTLKIVAFSDEIASRAKTAGLPYLRLKFFHDESKFPPTTWNQGRVLFYWNRTGMIGRKFLAKMCKSLFVDRLILLSDIDPGIPGRMSYLLPSRIGSTRVETIGFMRRSEFLSITNESNIFVAPRSAEGVGMSFLEAMARGAAVFAYDGPTMNEYIQSCRNGYMFSTIPADFLGRIITYSSLHPLSEHAQDWRKISSLDLPSLGEEARKDHQSGYLSWKESLRNFAEFILCKT